MSTPPAKEPHYTKIGEWVSECGANGMETAVYQHLAKRLHHASGLRIVDPSRARLAADVGLKKMDDVDPYLRALDALGAIVIHAKKGMRTKYELPLWPPDGYDGPSNTVAADKWQKDDPEGYAAWRASRRALVEAAEAPYAAKRRARVAKSTARKRSPKTPDVPVATGTSDGEEVPVATGTYRPVATGSHPPVATGTNHDGPNDQTNMGNGRQASTGSSASGGGGFAASANKIQVVDKLKPATLRAVVEGMPDPLKQLLQEDWPRGLPGRVNELIEAGLTAEHRTAGQLLERMGRRWQAFGYEDALLSQSGKGIRKGIGVLEELLAPSKCWGNNIDCEDGSELYTGRECPRCAEARQDRFGTREGDAREAEGAPDVARVPVSVRRPVPEQRVQPEGTFTDEGMTQAQEEIRAALQGRARLR
jgi:hypothetical protein